MGNQIVDTKPQIPEEKETEKCSDLVSMNMVNNKATNNEETFQKKH